MENADVDELVDRTLCRHVTDFERPLYKGVIDDRLSHECIGQIPHHRFATRDDPPGEGLAGRRKLVDQS